MCEDLKNLLKWIKSYAKWDVRLYQEAQVHSEHKRPEDWERLKVSTKGNLTVNWPYS